ncbi:MAG: Rrf2 family transcriptional regulator [Bacteroidota bacterium]
MTVFFSKKCELALQAVLFLSIQPKGQLFGSGEIAQRMNLPKEFVSKSLQTLTKTGIIGSKKGKTGGFFLAKNPKAVRLIDIVQAIDGLDIFHECVLGFYGCSDENPCPVHNKWGSLRTDTQKMLTEQTLDELRDFTKRKIDSIK